MRKTVSIIAGAILAVALGSPAWAHPGKGKGGGGGGESMAGGLPALEDRVDALQAQVTTLQGDVSTLTSEVNDLAGQNNWAVVDSTGAVVRSSGAPGSVTATATATGVYQVTFSKDVSACAYVASLGDTSDATPPIGFVGVAGTTSLPDVVTVQTTDETGTLADEPFHLYVSCP